MDAMYGRTHDWRKVSLTDRSHKHFRVFRKPTSCNHLDRTRPIHQYRYSSGTAKPMEASPAQMARPAAELHPQHPNNHQSRPVKWIDSRDNVTILLLLIISIFSQSVPWCALPLSTMLYRRLPPIFLILGFTR